MRHNLNDAQVHMWVPIRLTFMSIVGGALFPLSFQNRRFHYRYNNYVVSPTSHEMFCVV
jgi:hypothetical protein